eukprot:1588895-Lingulodinium_polyedra.AAC.1
MLGVGPRDADRHTVELAGGGNAVGHAVTVDGHERWLQGTVSCAAKASAPSIVRHEAPHRALAAVGLDFFFPQELQAPYERAALAPLHDAGRRGGLPEEVAAG